MAAVLSSTNTETSRVNHEEIVEVMVGLAVGGMIR